MYVGVALRKTVFFFFCNLAIFASMKIDENAYTDTSIFLRFVHGASQHHRQCHSSSTSEWWSHKNDDRQFRSETVDGLFRLLIQGSILRHTECSLTTIDVAQLDKSEPIFGHRNHQGTETKTTTETNCDKMKQQPWQLRKASIQEVGPWLHSAGRPRGFPEVVVDGRHARLSASCCWAYAGRGGGGGRGRRSTPGTSESFGLSGGSGAISAGCPLKIGPSTSISLTSAAASSGLLDQPFQSSQIRIRRGFPASIDLSWVIRVYLFVHSTIFVNCKLVKSESNKYLSR